MNLRNVASWDRIVRILLGILLLYLGWGGIVSGGAGTALKILGFVPLITGLVGYCPLYSLLRIRTNQAK
jgi:hypothetical protein